LLLQNGAKIESKDNNGRTPLSWATEKGNHNVARLLEDKCSSLTLVITTL
ncbi:hypothetical protein BDW69DRAFT_172412, partial [Aspergillus filifer]